MRTTRAGLRRALVVLLVVLLGATSAAAERIVAIGDIHGAYDELVELLLAAGLVDADLDWAGGDTTFVQVGDFMDRGPGVRRVMDLLRKLQEQAPADGGRVEVLLGNHEALNLVGELRDTSRESLAEFADAESDARRAEAWDLSSKAARRRAKLIGGPRPSSNDRARETWMRTHPPGVVSYLASLEPDGVYGRWLRQLPAVVKIGDTLFLHGGLHPEVSKRSLEEINDQVHAELRRLDDCRHVLEGEGYLTLTDGSTALIQAGFSRLSELEQHREKNGLEGEDQHAYDVLSQCVNYEDWYLFGNRGPLWFRGYSPPTAAPGSGVDSGRWDDEEGPVLAAQILRDQGVHRVVVGHTPQLGGTVTARFAGRIFLIDAGMLESVYHGRAAALEIDGDRVAAIYPDEREVLWTGIPGAVAPPPHLPAESAEEWTWRGPDGAPLPFTTPEELEEFLRTAEVVSSKTLGQGITRPTKVLLEKDGVRANAIFKSASIEIRGKAAPDGHMYRVWRDDFIFECAAYEVDRALGLNRVPPVVQRHLFSQDGALQAWVENTMMDAERVEKGLQPPDPVSWSREQMEKLVFDALINNRDRSHGNSLIDSAWKVWLIDHSRSFSGEHGDERIEALRAVPRPLWDHMRHVDLDALRARLEPYLDPFELDAFFERWDKVMLHFRSLVSEQGSEAVLLELD